VPIRLYLTQRLPKRQGAPVEAKVIDPVYAFDHQVIPSGAIVLGKVTSIRTITGWQRFNAIAGGDFTPLHTAGVEFTTLVLPDGRRMPLKTAETSGLNTILPARAAAQPAAPADQNNGILGAGKQQAKDAVHAQIGKIKSIPSIVRGPDKKERVEDYLVSRLPYHPQYVRKGTRFDAELTQPLDFGSESVSADSLAPVGTEPPLDSVAHARLITQLDSASAKQGEPVHAVLAEPVFSADHKLILPEGTRLDGVVVAANKARMFHRGGLLRFTFRDLELPPAVARIQSIAPAAPDRPHQDALTVRTQANLQNAESDSKNGIKVDGEGGVQAKESKTRFLALAASFMVARTAGDNDAIRNQSHQVVGQSQNIGGRTLGGGLGFGLLGMAISQTSRYVGSAFGYYGLARSFYSTIIARGAEVEFRKDAVIDVRFNSRPAQEAAAH
jgi:hypothetical protein